MRSYQQFYFKLHSKGAVNVYYDGDDCAKPRLRVDNLALAFGIFCSFPWRLPENL
jgi:hypothetical protein